MSKTIWLAYLFNFSFFVIFLAVAEFQFNLVNQAGTHLTWTSWNFHSFTIQTFNYQLGRQASFTDITPISNVITYPNYLTLVFTVYFFGNIGFLNDLRKKGNKDKIETKQ